jgi:hypothetical protein
LGCLGLIVVIWVIGAIAGSFNHPGSRSAETRSSAGWSHKAVASVDDADRIVGGFSDQDRRLYDNGVQHIRNVHGNIGSFTIRQVVDGEQSRASQRDAAAKAAEAKVAAAKAAEEANYMHGTPDCLLLDRRSIDSVADEYTSYVVGKIKNACDRDFGYVQVQANFYDGSGNLQDSGLANVNNLSAGQTWSFKILHVPSNGSGGSYKYQITKFGAF